MNFMNIFELNTAWPFLGIALLVAFILGATMKEHDLDEKVHHIQ